MRHYRTIAFACLVVLVAAPASAEDGIRAELDACRALADDGERLACYDRATGRILARAAAPEPAPAAAAPPASAPAAATTAAAAAATDAAPAPVATDNFGRERVLAAEEAKRREQETRAVGELSANVTGIDTRMDGLMTITLDNGQVWRQTRPDSMFRLKTGDRIKIQPGALKSFILSGPSNRSTRVSRVQ
jgi:hypothetical protein